MDKEKRNQLIDQGIEEAYEILSASVIRNIWEDMEGSYEHWNYLDFSDEVIEFVSAAEEKGDRIIHEILEPAMLDIGKRVREALEA